MQAKIPKNRWRALSLVEVVPGMLQLPLSGTSALLAMEERVTIIDAGWKGNGRRVLDALHRLGRSSDDIAYIVSTHYHPDHVGGIPYLQEKSDGQVAAHEIEVPYLQNPDPPNAIQSAAVRLLCSPIYPMLQPTPFPVDLPLSDGSSLDTLGGMNIVHTPGHTPGSISLHFPQHGLLMVGDALISRRGKLCLPSRIFSSDMDRAKDSVRKMARLDFDTICFSHFPPIRRNASRLLRQFAESLA